LENLWTAVNRLSIGYVATVYNLAWMHGSGINQLQSESLWENCDDRWVEWMVCVCAGEGDGGGQLCDILWLLSLCNKPLSK
jgi:hypothetical protein